MKKYTKEQILIAGEIGEVSMIDVRHVVSLLDEAVILERERKLRKHNVIKSYCEICADYEDGDSDNITCSKCKRKVRL